MVNFVNEGEHVTLIKDVLKSIFESNASSEIVLKGGTALLLYYGLDRFSEDIDLVASKVNIGPVIREYAISKGYTLRITTDTKTVKRYMLDYGEDSSLKIEVSYRGDIDWENVKEFEKVNVYSPTKLMVMKVNAFLSPTWNKIRDLYDIAYLFYDYEVELTQQVVERLTDMFAYENLEYIDQLIDNHKDPIIPVKDLERLRESMYSIYSYIYED